MRESASPSEVLQAYFAETMQGDLTAVDRYFTEQPDYVLISPTNPELASILPWVGAQPDRESIKSAYGKLLSELAVVGSTPGATFEAGENVFVSGSFRYEARATGKVVESDWAVHATVRDGRIHSFHFYEDSHAVASAFA